MDNINKTKTLNNINLMLKNDNLVAELSKCDFKKMQNKLIIFKKEQDAAFSTKNNLNI